MKEFVYYKKPVLLNSVRHSDYWLAPITGDYSYAKTTNSVLINADEFVKMASQCAIVFTKSGENSVQPIVLLSTKSGENDFIDAQGQWTGRYIPAFIKLYPFVLSESHEQAKLNVCIDEAYAGFTDHTTAGALPLFTEDQQGPVLQQAMKTLTSFQHSSKKTAAWVAKLQQQELLTPLSNKGDKSNLWVIDERKLQQMDDQHAVSLFRSGELAWIYSHLLSLAHLVK